MPRPVREAVRTEIAEEIKAVARRQMEQHGTAGLSLRGIAREMNITAPAIYNYFPRLEDLITALIVDAFESVAQAMQSASDAETSARCAAKIRARARAYRQWALENPIRFQLIYGNPIPGYTAPFEITAPLARKPFEGMIEQYLRAWETGELVIPDLYREIPPTITEHILSWKASHDLAIPDPVFYLLVVGWATIHGMVMLELSHHSRPIIGDTEAFYRNQVDVLLAEMGFSSIE